MAKNEDAAKQALAGSNYDSANLSPGFLFWKAFNAWSRSIRTELDKLKLTQVQYSILAATSYLGSNKKEVTQQDIANQLSMDKMMVSDVVKTLESKKFLSRKPHSSDGRAFALTLTAKALQLLKRAIPAVEQTDEAFFAKLTVEERRSLLKLLLQLSDS